MDEREAKKVNQFYALPQSNFTEEDNIVFLLKSMKHKYVIDTLKKGRFCFNQPALFNNWADKDSAQYDKWDAHSAFNITRMVVNPIVDIKTGKPDFNTGEQYQVEGEMHLQSDFVKYSPICSFRCIRRKDVEIIDNFIYYSLGDSAERIEKEFGHDEYIIVPIKPFLDLFNSKGIRFTSMEMVYQDTLNEYPFLSINTQMNIIVEQLFRKDKAFEWQKEYRIALAPTSESRVFVELGSIESIASFGRIMELKEKQRICQLI